MSTEKLDQYKKLYSEYIELSVDLHNYHQSFLKYQGKKTGLCCKRAIKSMRKVLYDMEKLNIEVRVEFIKNWRADVESRKIKLPDGTIKRKRKKNGQFERTITKTV
ncbi:hypothetical protein EB118_17295 [bacterium]|nr:hypothetical protein [bacterium]